MKWRDPKMTARGASRLELLVCLAVLLVVVGLFLQRLRFYQATAERMQMEATASVISSALRIRQAELMVANRNAEISDLVGSNGFLLLDPPPANYRGVCSDGIRSAGWCYEAARGVMVYVPRLTSYLAGGADISFRIDWPLRKKAIGAEQVPTLVVLNLLNSYDWADLEREQGRWPG